MRLKKILCVFCALLCLISINTTSIHAQEPTRLMTTSTVVNHSWFTGVKEFFGFIEGYYDEMDYQIASDALGVSEDSLKADTTPNATGDYKGTDEMVEFMDDNWSWKLSDPINSLCRTIGWSVIKTFVSILSVGTDFFEITGYSVVGFYPTFANDLINTVVKFFAGLTWVLFGIGLILSLCEEAIRYSNGQGSISTLALNIVKGFLYTFVFIAASAFLYNIACDTGISLANAIITTDAGAAAGIGSAVTTGGLIGMIALVSGKLVPFLLTNPIAGFSILIVICLLIIKTVFFLLKKIPQFLSMIMKGSVMSFFIVRGNNSTVQSYFIQLGMFYLQIMGQFVFLSLGFALMLNAMDDNYGFIFKTLADSNFLIGLVIIASANEVGGWLGGLSGEDDLGKAVGTMHHASGLVKGGAEFLTGISGLNAAQQANSQDIAKIVGG